MRASINKKHLIIDTSEFIRSGNKEKSPAFSSSLLFSPEERTSTILRSTPTKSIFLNFVSNFLSGDHKKHKSRPAKTLNSTPCNSNAPSIPEFSRTFRSKLPFTPKESINISKKPKESKVFAFPSLRPNSNLNAFLEKEKIRITASQSERLLNNKLSIADENKNRGKIGSKKKHKKSKSKKRKLKNSQRKSSWVIDNKLKPYS